MRLMSDFLKTQFLSAISEEEDALITSWIKYTSEFSTEGENSPDAWSALALWRVERTDPLRCLHLVLEILRRIDPSDTMMLASIGAGPLENRRAVKRRRNGAHPTSHT